VSAMLIAVAVVICVVSGIPSLVSPRASRLSLILILAGFAIGLAGAVVGFGAVREIAAPWAIPGGELRIRVDALSAFFVIPVFLLATCGAIYAEGYWPPQKPRAAYLRFFYGVLVGSLALVMVAQNTILFLMAWELVALSSYFVVATLDDDADVRAAAWLYLVASHVATLALFAMVSILHSATGTWTFTALPHASPATRAILWLALIGFGIKAGIMPFHVWLPGAHAGAPSHISAIMSGVVIKMGIYGIVRVLSLVDAPPDWFGGVLLAAGIVSSIFGVAFALAQHDLKRLLAYHSIENIGIIVIGLGVGVVARAHGQPAIAFVGFAGALLHVWNHALFKSLLFFGAGSAIHASGTREIDRMGGLAKRMPWTSIAFLTGAVAISGLPPLNGFVSEWLLYVASFAAVQRSAGGATWLMLIAVAPALALTGALALACFVKAFGAVFLGSARSDGAANGHESPAAMRFAMLPLMAACFAIGLLPLLFLPAVTRAVGAASGLHGTIVNLLGPLQLIALGTALLLMLALLALRLRVGNARRSVTWDCGYTKPTARMQYTSSSFARGLMAFFGWAMPPVVHAPRRLGFFPQHAALETHVPDTILDRILLPLAERARRTLMLARIVQSGRMQIYLLYIGATLLALLAWSIA